MKTPHANASTGCSKWGDHQIAAEIMTTFNNTGVNAGTEKLPKEFKILLKKAYKQVVQEKSTKEDL